MDDSLKPFNQQLRDYWEALVRRRWWLIGPFFLLGWLGFGVAYTWPYRYRSEAVIQMERQKVPAQYVTPNVVSDLQDRLQSMKQQVLSRSRLQRLIEQFNLYSQDRTRMAIEDVVEKMREDVHVDPDESPGRHEGLTTFRISFAAKNPLVAQQITDKLTSLFIEEDLQDRTEQSVGTTSFLESQVEQARKDLADQEARQREYKLRYLGQLPEQQQANLQILGSLEGQLHSVSDSLNRAEQQKIYLESMRDQYRAMQRSLGGGPGSVGVSPVATAEAAISDLRKQLVGLEANYTPQHPDIVKLKEKIDQWEALKLRLQAEQESIPKAEPKVPAPTAAADPALIEVESRLKSLALEMRDYIGEMGELRTRVRQYQSRLSLTPMREQQLTEVTRAYENSRQFYQSLLQKKLQSELATNLEKRQQGQQFRIVDPANLPTKPDKPTPIQIILAGWGGGLAVGMGLIILREISDVVLRNERDVSSSTKLPILVRIPILSTPREEIRQRWYRGLEVVGVTLLITLTASIGIYYNHLPK